MLLVLSLRNVPWLVDLDGDRQRCRDRYCHRKPKNIHSGQERNYQHWSSSVCNLYMSICILLSSDTFVKLMFVRVWMIKLNWIERISCNDFSIYRVWRFVLSLVKQKGRSIIAKLQLILRHHLCRRVGIPSLCSHVCHRRDFTKINLKPLVQIILQTYPGTNRFAGSLSSVQSRLLGAVFNAPFWRSSYLRVCNGTAFHTKSLNFVYIDQENRRVSKVNNAFFNATVQTFL